MFSNKKSYYFIIPFIIAILIFLGIIFSNLFVNNEKKINEINNGTELKVNNRTFILKEINRTDEFFYLELVEDDWLNFEKIMNIKANFNNDEKIIENVVKIRFKGFYFLKIPTPKKFNYMNLIFEEDGKEYKLSFSKKNYKEIEYNEKSVKEYKINYLEFCIELNKQKIGDINTKIYEKNEEIEKVEKDIEELKNRSEFQVEEELNNTKSKIKSLTNSIEKLNDDILEFKNNIVTFENKNLMLNAEINYVNTGKKKRVVLISKLDKNGNKVVDLEAKEFSEKEEEREKKEEEKNQKDEKKEEKKDNNSSSNTKSKNSEIKVQKTNNSINKNSQKNETKVQKNTKNNVSNSDIKVKKNDKKNKEVEVEFTP